MASTSLYTIINEIKQDISRIGNKIAKGVATVAFQDLQEAHREIMESFYNGYTPVRSYRFWYEKDGHVFMGKKPGYKRTNNLRYNSIIPEGIVSSGKHSFQATIQVGASNMSDYTNNTGRTFPAEGVFDLMWNQSIRGLPPGNRGHVGTFSISAAPVGVGISGSPENAMHDFVEQWGNVRGAQVADMIASSV